jgi:ribosomal-protein-alanine N-acetyltransferase
MRTDLTFRAPRASDVEAIAALEAVSFPSPWKAEFFASELDLAGRHNLVLITGEGRLIGYLFTMHYLDELHVNKIAIDPEWRRFGLARALMERCFDFARGNDITSITLEVREANSAARALYRDLGFTEAYVRPNYYPEGEAAVVMARSLANPA